MKLQWWRLQPLSGALIQTLTLSGSRRCCSASRSFCSGSSSSSFALKNVTRSNFGTALADLRRLVHAADFVAVDLEMTGVASAPWREAFDFDRADIRYLKIKDSAEKFAVVQFGVCPFRWDPPRNCFVAHPHNFYVFLRQERAVDGQNYEFLCQTSSIDFLAKYQFDFNMCIHEGISYLSRGQEEEALRRLTLEFDKDLSEMFSQSERAKDVPLVRMADIFFTERMKNRIGEWCGGLLHERINSAEAHRCSSDLKQQCETTFYKTRPALKLAGFTSHQMKLIKLVTKKHFEDLVYVRVNEDSCLQHLIVYTESKKDRSILMKEVKDDLRKEAEKQIKASAGFREVIDLLSSEQKLVVGHNCFLDFAHIYSKFLGVLPSSVEEFVSSLHKFFPSIIDTKVLLNTNSALQYLMKKGSTSLSKAFALLCPELASSHGSSSLAFKPCVKVEVQVDDMSSCNWNSGAKHEAGYDAFMTGCIFAQACSHLGVEFKLHLPFPDLLHNEKLQKYVNLLYLSWNNGEIIDLRSGILNGEHLWYNSMRRCSSKVLFSNVVLIWGFPSKVKARKIRECISKVFGPSSVTSIYQLDETAVFVQFNNADLVLEFLSLKETLEKNNDPISVLHPLSELLDGGSTHAASYEVYKEICSSPVSKVLFTDQAAAVGIKWKTKYVETKAEMKIQGNDIKDGSEFVPDPSSETMTPKMEDKAYDPARIISQVMGL